MPDRPDLTPKRMRYASVWRLSVAAVDALYGGVFVFGGTANASYQQLLIPIMPMSMWGALLVLAGAFLSSRRLEIGGVLGSLVWLTFSIMSAITIFHHTAESATGPILLTAFAFFHWLITVGATSGLAANRR